MIVTINDTRSCLLLWSLFIIPSLVHCGGHYYWIQVLSIVEVIINYSKVLSNVEVIINYSKVLSNVEVIINYSKVLSNVEVIIGDSKVLSIVEVIIGDSKVLSIVEVIINYTRSCPLRRSLLMSLSPIYWGSHY